MRAFRLATISAAAIMGVMTPVSAWADCILYEHRDFGGAYYYLGNGDRMRMVNGENTGCIRSNGTRCGYTYYEPSLNDAVSSFRATGGCTLTLWEDIDQGGAYFRSSRSYSYVGDDWNDEASEALCVCS